MTVSRWAVAAVLAALVILGFYTVPGHTFLASDTQIYIPILERFADPTLYPHDSVATRPHVTYSIYDETALLLRRLSGAGGFQGVLVFQQLIARFCALLGVYLLARALALPPLLALLVPVVYGLGATVAGPAVLTFEYEPVPRGTAICLLVLALGLFARRRLTGAAVATGIAFLTHPPTAWPVLAVFGLYLLFEARREGLAALRPLVILAAFAAGLFVFSRFQAGESEKQALFLRIDGDLARLQRLRGAYNWVSLWPAPYLRMYEFLAAFIALATVPLRPLFSRETRWVFFGIPIVAFLSIPLSLMLLEGLRWSLIPAFQPARATAFLFVIAIVLSAAAGIAAAREGRTGVAFLWLLVGFAIPAQTPVLDLLLPDFRSPLLVKRFAISALAALGVAVGVHAYARGRRALAPLMLAALLPYALLPTWGEVMNYRVVDTPEIAQLAQWARGHTPKSAMFLFPDGGKDPAASIFRARSLRGVYVDWKGGGQVNLLKDFADEWWERWSNVLEPGYAPERIPSYAARGIDYLVLLKKNRLPGQTPLFENERFLVYKIR